MEIQEAIKRMMQRFGVITAGAGVLMILAGFPFMLFRDYEIPIIAVPLIVVLIIVSVGWMASRSIKEGAFSTKMAYAYRKPSFLLPHILPPMVILSAWILLIMNRTSFGIVEVVTGVVLIAAGIWAGMCKVPPPDA